MLHAEITEQIIGAFYEVHRTLGFGFLESVYANALEHELRERGLTVKREVPVDVAYRGRIVGHHRIDILVNGLVVVEVKASRFLDPSADKQTLNYLRGTSLEVALLLHFGPRPAFRRFISTNRPVPALRDAIPPDHSADLHLP